MQAVIRGRKRVFILSQPISREIGLLLLDWNPGSFSKILKLVLKGVLFSRRSADDCNYLLLKTDHGGFQNPGFVESLKVKNIELVAIVHDLIPILNPEYCTKHNTVKFTKSMGNILGHAKGIVTVSDSTRTSLKEYLSRNGKIMPPSITSTLAPGFPPQVIQEQPAVKGPYFVIVSTIGARKNHLLLLQIWRNMVSRLGANAPKLVVIGKRSRTCANTIAMLDRCQELQGMIIERTCNDMGLANYIYHARALLSPSFTEGYGLPLVEALSLKVPVIASNIPVFREVAGTVPEYIDPLDGLGWMKCIEEYAKENSELRTAQLQRMVNFKVPCWDEHFTKVNNFLNTL